MSAAKRVSICRSVKTSSARSISRCLVLADPKTLSTLPDAYFTDGMGEVIKYGCIADAALFDKLEQGQVIDHLEETICRCVLCKKHFVEEDTNDKGRRMF